MARTEQIQGLLQRRPGSAGQGSGSGAATASANEVAADTAAASDAVPRGVKGNMNDKLKAMAHKAAAASKAN